ncbi:putative RNA recognition motif domain, nucleotide-binding alpha-beta plait domain superfamily [Helianthus annuus]|nr:putative RNA recognition motif domain, nucleotide-binding alpha-beta plait domain superfamily [Helianthus annuus]KAJ0746560.1 putative RNA recognition motif domain, nucleotide-binding alpha-beta plait domain superfamily [Helianthus annuus]
MGVSVGSRKDAQGGRSGRFGGKNYFSNNGWNTIVSKNQARQERLFANKEMRLRNATSFFISNLPESCNHVMLWKAFGVFENLVDAFVPLKKDRVGNKFGFIKLSKVNDTSEWIEKLKEVRIEGAVIGVNLAKFDRLGAKIEPKKSGERISVFSRLPEKVLVGLPGTNPGVKADQNRNFRSYSSVVNAGCSVIPKNVIDLPPVNTDTKKKWEYKALVGEVKDIEILNNLNLYLPGLTEDGIDLRYLGGLKVLLCFNSPVETEEFWVQSAEVWEKWFPRLYV